MMKRGINQMAIGLSAFVATSFVALAMAPASDAARAPAARSVVMQSDPLPAALDAVRPGLWAVRGEGLAPRRLCLGDRAVLVQLRHAGATCGRLVVASGPRAATVQYSCPGAGWGRTALTVEGPEVVRIDSQGIADNAPFAWTAEARREGDCRPGTL